jgi:hypothetical protein
MIYQDSNSSFLSHKQTKIICISANVVYKMFKMNNTSINNIYVVTV